MSEGDSGLNETAAEEPYSIHTKDQVAEYVTYQLSAIMDELSDILAGPQGSVVIANGHRVVEEWVRMGNLIAAYGLRGS